jgi:hypothetical protein
VCVCVCRCIIRWIRFQLISHWILDTHGIDISRGKGSINLDVHEIFFGSCDGLMLTIEKFILNHPKCARLFSDARDDRVYWSPASSYFLVKNKTRAAEYWSPALLDSFLIWWRRPLSAFSLSLSIPRHFLFDRWSPVKRNTRSRTNVIHQHTLIGNFRHCSIRFGVSIFLWFFKSGGPFKPDMECRWWNTFKIKKYNLVMSHVYQEKEPILFAFLT